MVPREKPGTLIEKMQAWAAKYAVSQTDAGQVLHFKEKNLHSSENSVQKFNLHSVQWSSFIIYSTR